MGSVDFDGQVAIVTGAGGALGRSYALELARRGAAIVVNDLGGDPDGSGRSSGPADETVALIAAAGGQAVASHDSVATREGGEAIVQRALDSFGRVDIVINNAGSLRDRTFAKLAIEDVQAIVDVHLYGAFHVSRPAFLAMRERSYGRILMTASSSGLFGNFGQANYAAAKMGVVGLSNVLAIEGARHGITSNVIAPMADSRLTAGLSSPMEGMLSPEAVTPLAVYLVSRECELTHEIFSAAGARYARVFLGLTPGWFAGKDELPSVEDIAEHLEEIRDEEGYGIPLSVIDEGKALHEQLFED